MNILFRCDGSVEIGMGHVVRCLALADHLRENYECKIHFAMRRSKLGIDKVKESYPVLRSNEEAFYYENWMIDCIRRTESDILIMDMRDGLTRMQLKKIKSSKRIKVVTIDDPEDKRLESDLAFYPPVAQLEEIDWGLYRGDLRIGWEYVILRPEFKDYARQNSLRSENILVSMGGTDPFDLTGLVAEALNQVKGYFRVTFLLGAGYSFMQRLEEVIDTVDYSYNLFNDPQNISKVMANCDIAIISFGQTAYELAVLGIPAIYIGLTEDHCRSALLFMKEQYGRLLGEYLSLEPMSVATGVEEFIRDCSSGQFKQGSTQSRRISDLDLMSFLILGRT